MTDNTQDLISQSMRESATLVSLTARVWSGTANDKKAVMEMAEAAGAKRGDVGRFAKNLLAGVDTKLKAVHAAVGAGRTTHYHMTLPWSSAGDDQVRRGPRVLPNALFMQYAKRMGQHRNDVRAKLDQFISAYPKLVEDAAENLGGLYDERMYPDANTIVRKFGFDFEFMPIPASTDFKGLPPQVLEQLGNNIEKRVNRRVEGAMQEAWSRTRQTVEHMVERLSGDEPKKFHDTLVTNARELCDLLKALNITNDPNLEEIRRDIEQGLVGHDAKELRKSETVRKGVASEAQRILDKMASWQ